MSRLSQTLDRTVRLTIDIYQVCLLPSVFNVRLSSSIRATSSDEGNRWRSCPREAFRALERNYPRKHVSRSTSARVQIYY